MVSGPLGANRLGVFGCWWGGFGNELVEVAANCCGDVAEVADVLSAFIAPDDHPCLGGEGLIDFEPANGCIAGVSSERDTDHRVSTGDCAPHIRGIGERCRGEEWLRSVAKVRQQESTREGNHAAHVGEGATHEFADRSCVSLGELLSSGGGVCVESGVLDSFESMVQNFDPFPGLQPIGYWVDHDQPHLPDPALLVDQAWDVCERQLVARVLAAAATHQPGEGCSLCRICAAPNGFLDLSDGTYVWPEGLAHYVLDHAVRLPAGVVAHLLARDSDPDAIRPGVRIVS